MQFQFEDHVLDCERRELRRGTTQIPLEPQVFDLLVYLISHRNRVVSKDDLLDSIWSGRTVSESTLTSRVAAARRAIGDSGEAQRLIRTVPRKGLRFVAEVREQQAAAAGTRKQQDAAATSVGEQLGATAAAGEQRAPGTSADKRERPGAAAAAEARPRAAELPGKPSIAVLAFDSLSNDPDQDYLSTGLAEDIITDLSRRRSLLVVARNSSFTYKGRAVDVRTVSRELGVRYVVEGSVRRAGDQLRITAQLIDAESGGHIWAGRYDRKYVELFAVQDEITAAIVAAIMPAVSQAEQRRSVRKAPDRLDSWEAYQRGLCILTEAGDDDIAAAREWFRRSAELDPHFAPAQAMLAHVTLNQTSRGQGSMTENLQRAEAHARRAIALDAEDPGALGMLSWIASLRGDMDAALMHAEHAVACGPNDPRGYLVRARALICSGEAAQAAADLDMALRLTPRDPYVRLVLLHVAWAAYYRRDYATAVQASQRSIRDFPGYPHAYVWLAAALGQTGPADAAQLALRRAMEVSPATFDWMAATRQPCFRPEDHAHLLEGLRKAGWAGGGHQTFPASPA